MVDVGGRSFHHSQSRWLPFCSQMWRRPGTSMPCIYFHKQCEVLRRGSRPARAGLQIGDLEVDRVSHTVRRGSHNIDLSPKEFALLEFLMRHEGQPVSRTAIVEQVWKLNFDTM